MQNYLDLLQLVLDTGVEQENRTGITTFMIPGAMLKYDLREGFPICTTKQTAFKAVKGELIGFLRSYTNAADFRALGCSVWDKNANSPGKDGFPNAWLSNPNRKGVDDLGVIYGSQWRHWKGGVKAIKADPVSNDGKNITFNADLEYDEIDQVQEVLLKLRDNPTDRRMIINAWNPSEFKKMSLVPCHVLYQFIAEPKSKLLHLCMYQRSCDLGLGVPFNISSAALFLSLISKLSGFTAGTFTHFLADAHIYVSHIEALKVQLTRKPYLLPKLNLDIDGVQPYTDPDWAFKLEPDMITLSGYVSHPSLKMEMAV